MKRLLTLITAILLLAAPALAWEVSDEMIDFAMQVAPGHTLLDGFLFDDTAMLLLEDAQGQVFFAGCVRDGDEWVVTLSTPIPEGTFAAISYASSSMAVLNLDHSRLFQPRHPLGATDCNFTIRLQEGSWAIEGIGAGHDSLYFDENCVWSEFGRVCYGESLFSLDIAEVDWLTVPLTVEEAAARMDVSDWAISAQEAVLYASPDGEALALYNPGTPLLILDRRIGWVEAAVLGGHAVGWFREEGLLIGENQLQASNLTLYDLPYRNLNDELDEILVYTLPDGYVIARIEPNWDVHFGILGEWADGWLHVFDQTIPGREGFIREEDLAPLNENGPWG